MQHLPSNLSNQNRELARVLSRREVTALLANMDSRRFAYRARVEREKARDAANPYERMVHLRAAKLHRQLALSISSPQPFAAETWSATDLGTETVDAAFSDASGPRLRVLLLIMMGASAPLVLLGAASSLFQMLAG